MRNSRVADTALFVIPEASDSSPVLSNIAPGYRIVIVARVSKRAKQLLLGELKLIVS